MTQGKFITLEGGEGVGKSTQALRLGDSLRKRGLDMVVTREPGGTAGAEAIRKLLTTGATDRWSARAEALLFAAARADHVEKVIRPALTRGAWVICDRFIDSTRAYQGGVDGVTDADILAMHAFASGGLMPDRTVLLTLPEAAATERTRRRVGSNDDRFDNREAAFHRRISAAFLSFAANEPDRFRQVDTSGSIESIAEKIHSEIGDLF